MNGFYLDKRARQLCWLALGLLYWGVVLIRLRADHLDLGGDSAQYIIIAEAFSQGTGLRMVNYPGAPLSTLAPLFSIFLSPLLFFKGRDLGLMQMLPAAFGFGACLVFYHVFKKAADRLTAFLSVTALCFSGLFLARSAEILTDMPFLFFCGLSLLSLQKYLKAPAVTGAAGKLAALAMLAAYFTRYIGAVLLPAAVIGLLADQTHPFKKRAAKAGFLAGVCLPVFLLWAFRNACIENPYLFPLAQQFSFHDSPGLAVRIAAGCIVYAQVAAAGLAPLDFSAAPVLLKFIFSLGLAMIVALGLWLKIKKGAPLLPVFFVCYLAPLLVWPYYEDGRYFLPILPLAVFFFFYYFSVRSAGRSFAKPVLAGYALLLASAGIIFSPHAARLAQLTPEVKDYLAIHAWVKENLKSDGVVLSRKPTVTYYYSGHRAVGYPLSARSEDFIALIKHADVRYIIAERFSPATAVYLWRFIDSQRGRLKVLHQEGQTLLLETAG